MGALCGKESSNDPFAGPGRTLSSAPAPQTTSSVPAQRKVGGPPRTLGGSSDANTSSSAGTATTKAAQAALKRDQEAKKKPTGLLSSNLQKQKSQSTNAIMQAVAAENDKHKKIDANTKDVMGV